MNPSWQRVSAACTALFLLCGCAPGEPTGAMDAEMNEIAEAYVRVVLAVGLHDPDYVDAYYGPPEWREEVNADTLALTEIAGRAQPLIDRLRALDLAAAQEIVLLRREYLARQLESLVSRVGLLQGTSMSFDEESRALYDAVAPAHPESHFDSLLARLEPLLPGSGPVATRYEQWRQAFIIPKERLDTVFKAAIAEARARTVSHIELPQAESFTLEYVTGKTWSGYNWYQGEVRSLIQINTDFPITIDRAIDLAAHEGYPGHHVYNVLLESALVRERGWVEFSVYPLFSPQSLIAEGSANFGIDVAFPGEERVTFERDVLYPLAGLDPARVDEYARVMRLVDALSYAGNDAARRYLDGQIDAEAAASWLHRYALYSLDRARQRVGFIEQYRSYVINYNLGQDLVRAWVESRGGTDDDPARRWEVFAQLLSSPRLPSGLR